jgi:hypothetical protein
MPIEGTSTIAGGERELARLLDEVGRGDLNWNEAETRFQIIDRLIVECLGWPRAEVKPERHDGGDYTDYELGEPRAVIWEAKRIGRTFELPANPNQRIIADLRSIMSTSAEAKDAIHQAQGYCSRRGVDLAVITNGHQIIAFLATRSDGIAPLDGNCFVIDGLPHLRINFPRFWQALSPQGVAQNKLKQLLRLGDEDKLPKKNARLIASYPTFRVPTKADKDLQIIAELLLVEIVEWREVEAEFYRRCYCKNWTLSQFGLVSKQIIEARYAAIFADSEAAPSIVPIKRKKWPALFDNEMLAEALSRRPIILLGDVGVGKTAFLKNLMFVEAMPEFERSIYIYVDFGSQGALAEDMRRFVLDEIERQLLKKYDIDVCDNAFVEAVYAADLDRFTNGVFGALRGENPTLYMEKRIEFLEEKIRVRDQHISRAVTHLISMSKRQVIVVLDNSDQRAIDVQIEVFAIAHELSKHWDVIAFAAIRPKTYLQIRKDATIGMDAQHVFTIAPPQLEEAIKLRLHFAVDISEGRYEVARLQGISFDLVNFSAMARGIINAIERKDVKLRRLFANFFNGNVADAVYAVWKFFGNPNTNSRRIINISKARNGAGVAIRDILASLLYSNFWYYSPTTTGIINLFDTETSNPSEHFLLPMLLGYLNYDGSHRNRDGFVDTKNILAEMQDWGFSPMAIQRVLGRASSIDRPLIDRARYEGHEVAVTQRYRINTTGAYYLSDLCASYAYLEAVWCDTPIFDDATRNLLASRAGSNAFGDRYRRAAVFRDYLTDVWNGSGLRPGYFNWMNSVQDAQLEFGFARAHSERGDRSSRSGP